ncbi:MAG: TraR/DksA C4-type zinc finger protein [Dehalococcoidales bacterium]|nr:TraR/DksA C4-type zinc finger protein [Dehalococcoidales bacterium]
MALDLQALRKRLDAERVRLDQELKQMEVDVSTTEERREGSPFGKREEEATETLELEKRLALENRIRGQIAEIDRALQKMDSGTYGKCDVCGQTIDPARLEALPQATLCLSCKAKNVKPKAS